MGEEGCYALALSVIEPRSFGLASSSFAGDKIQKNEMGGSCGTYGGRGVHKVLVGKPEGKRPLGRPKRRWEENIKMDLEEVGRGCGD